MRVWKGIKLDVDNKPVCYSKFICVGEWSDGTKTYVETDGTPKGNEDAYYNSELYSCCIISRTRVFFLECID